MRFKPLAWFKIQMFLYISFSASYANECQSSQFFFFIADFHQREKCKWIFFVLDFALEVNNF